MHVKNKFMVICILIIISNMFTVNSYSMDVEREFEEKFKQLTANHSTESLYELGRMYEEGIFVSKNLENAFIYYQLAASKNNARAKNILKSDIFASFTKEQSSSHAANTFIALNSCDVFSEIELLIGNPVPPAYNQQQLQALLKKDDSKGHYALGYAFYSGSNFPQNYSEANAHFKLAADKGLAQAQFAYARAHLLGQGVAQNYALAHEYFKKAADQGLAIAQFQLGELYSSAKGVVSDPIIALFYLEQAAKQKLAQAQYLLGWHHEEGRGTAKNTQRAYDFYVLSSKQDLVIAHSSLARMYAKGIHVKKDIKKAFEIAQKAADKNSPHGQAVLASLYKSSSKKGDMQKAFSYYQLAADQGLIAAQSNIAEMYLCGFGCQKDASKAIVLIRDICLKNNNITVILKNLFDTLSLNFNNIKNPRKNDYIEFYTLLRHFEEIEEEMLERGKISSSQANFANYFRLIKSSNSKTNRKFLNESDSLLIKNNAQKHIKLLLSDSSPATLAQLGTIYYKGEGVKRDYKKALDYYTQAYKLEDKEYTEKNWFNFLQDGEAVSALADMYYKGKGVDKNYKLAIKYYFALCFDMSYFKINYESDIRIAKMYFRGGFGIKQDIDAALLFIRRPAKENSHKAKKLMNRILLDKSDPKDFIEWCRYMKTKDPFMISEFIESFIDSALNKLFVKHDVYTNNHLDLLECLFQCKIMGYERASAYIAELKNTLALMLEISTDKIANLNYLKAAYSAALKRSSYDGIIVAPQAQSLDAPPGLESKPEILGERERKYEEGLDYLLGRGRDKNIDAAIECFKQAASAGSYRSKMQLVSIYFNMNDMDNMFKYYDVAMKQNPLKTGNHLNQNITQVMISNLNHAHHDEKNNHIEIYKNLYNCEKIGCVKAAEFLAQSRKLLAVSGQDLDTLSRYEDFIDRCRLQLQALKQPMQSSTNSSLAIEKKKKRSKTLRKPAKKVVISELSQSTAAPCWSQNTPIEKEAVNVRSKKIGLTQRAFEAVQAKLEQSRKDRAEKKLQKEIIKQEKEKRKLDKKSKKISSNTYDDSEVTDSEISSSLQSENSISVNESMLNKGYFDAVFNDSESMSMSMMSDSESHVDKSTMRSDYPHLYKDLNRTNRLNKTLRLNGSQVNFKIRKTTIKATLELMKLYRLIEGRTNGAKIKVNKIGMPEISFGSHTTHGSSNYAKWYHNPAIIKSFLDFAAQCDPIIKEFLFEKFIDCFARADFSDNNHRDPDAQGDVSKPD